MSCPVGYGSGRRADASLEAVEKQMSSQLPSCARLAESLEECRRRVAETGSGHCADESQLWTQCRNERERFERHHLPTACGGPLQKSFPQSAPGELPRQQHKFAPPHPLTTRAPGWPAAPRCAGSAAVFESIFVTKSRQVAMEFQVPTHPNDIVDDSNAERYSVSSSTADAVQQMDAAAQKAAVAGEMDAYALYQTQSSELVCPEWGLRRKTRKIREATKQNFAEPAGGGRPLRQAEEAAGANCELGCVRYAVWLRQEPRIHSLTLLLLFDPPENFSDPAGTSVSSRVP